MIVVLPFRLDVIRAERPREAGKSLGRPLSLTGLSSL
jgi:hypothetical protein